MIDSGGCGDTGPVTVPLAPARRVLARLVAVFAGVALVGAATLATPSPAVSATPCGALVVTPRPAASPPSLVVVVPSALSDRRILTRSWSLDQQGAVAVAAARPLSPSKLDLAVVLDTAADVPGPVYRRARSVVAALLDSLPAGVRVTVMAAGGAPVVLSPLGSDRAEAVDRVMDARRVPGHAWVDAIAEAAEALPDVPDRFAQVVVVTTGPDNRSVRAVDHVRSVLDTRMIALSVTAAGAPTTQPLWGDRCPPYVGGRDGAPAGELIARRVAGRYVVVAPGADLTMPLTVRVRSAAVDASAATAVPATATGAPETGSGPEVLGNKIGSPGPGGLATGWVPIGLGVLAVLLLATMSIAVLASTGRPLPFQAPASDTVGRSRSPGPQHDRPDEALMLEAWIVRICLLALLALALVARLWRDGADGNGPIGLAPLVLATALAAMGARWLWWATSPPYRLWPGGPVVWNPGVTAVAPFCLCLLPAVVLLALG